MAQDWTQTTRVLKAVVVILGIVIVVGLAVLIAEIGRRIFTAAETPAPAESGYAEAVVPLPAGARARAMTGTGTRATLLIDRADGRQELVTIDLATGAVIGRITLAPDQNETGRQ